jgi:hypothetical protein
MLRTIKLWCCAISLIIVNFYVPFAGDYHPTFWVRFIVGVTFFVTTTCAVFLPATSFNKTTN